MFLFNGQLGLDGSEEGRAWSMVIQEDTGTMSAAVAGNQVGFVVLGACFSSGMNSKFMSSTPAMKVNGMKIVAGK